MTRPQAKQTVASSSSIQETLCQTRLTLTQHYIGLCSLFLKQPSIIEVSIDESYFRILAGNLTTFIAVADQASDVKLRMSVGNHIESITTNISCRACAKDDS